MDFKPQQTPPRRPEDSFDGRPNPDNEPETYVTPEGQPTTLGETHAEPQAQTVVVPPKKSGAKKWLVGGLVVLALGGLGALAYWQWAEAENAKQELTSTKSALQAAQDSAKQDDDTVEPDAPAASTGEDFSAFIAEYNKIATAAVALTAADEKAIETTIKDYYKLTTLPAGWDIVTAYKDAKADSTTGKPVNALVYWPASAEKPASFFEVTQSADGKWAYNEQR